VAAFDANLEYLYKFPLSDQVRDAEGIAYHPSNGHLFLVSARAKAIFEYTLDGTFIEEYDIRGFEPAPKSPQGLTFGPTSDPNDDPTAMALYIADGGADESPDGRVYEVLIGSTMSTLGTVDSRVIEGLNPSGGDMWYQLKAAHQAVLTLQADTPDVEIALFDESLSPLATSVEIGGRARLDYPADADQTFAMRLSGTAARVGIQIANLVQQQGTVVTIRGTSGSDQFAFSAASTGEITINGIGYSFTAATSFSFDAGGGSDHLDLSGSSKRDTATLYPTKAYFIGAGFSLAATEIESSSFQGGGGKDIAAMHGSTAADTLVVGGETAGNSPRQAVLTGDGVSITAVANEIYAYGRGGQDTARLYDSTGKDVLVSFRKRVQMSGPGYFRRVQGFEVVFAHAGADFDTAEFRDSRLDDLFQANPNWARMLYPGTYRQAFGFDSVVSVSRSGKDRASLWDSTANDTISASLGEAILDYPDHTVAVRQFPTVNIFSGPKDADVAVLVDGVVDLATYGPPDWVDLDQIAQALWLNSVERIELRNHSSDVPLAEINGVDRVFACWK
jgi:hypothetical protein